LKGEKKGGKEGEENHRKGEREDALSGIKKKKERVKHHFHP